MKLLGKSRSFRGCFRPLDDDDGYSVKRNPDNDWSDNSVLTCYGIRDRESFKFSEPLVVSGDRRRKGRSRRSFSRILKAVFFSTSLNGKVRKREASDPQQKKYESTASAKHGEPLDDRRALSSRSSSSGHLLSKTASSSFRSSSCVSPFLADSTSSSSKRSSRSNSIESVHVSGHKSTETNSGSNGSSIGLCLLIFSLVVLILWGRVCAVFCTSALLYFASNRIVRVGSPGKVVDLPEMYSEKQQKM